MKKWTGVVIVAFCLSQWSCAGSNILLNQTNTASELHSYEITCTGNFQTEQILRKANVGCPTVFNLVGNTAWMNVNSILLQYDNVSEQTIQQVRGILVQCPGMFAVNIVRQ